MFRNIGPTLLPKRILTINYFCFNVRIIKPAETLNKSQSRYYRPIPTQHDVMVFFRRFFRWHTQKLFSERVIFTFIMIIFTS